MAEEAEEQEGQEGEGEEAPPPPPKKSPVMHLIILAIIIIAGQVAAVYFLINKSLMPKLMGDEGEETTDVAPMAGADAPAIPIDEPFLYPLATDKEEILVNPVDPIMIRFLNAQVVLQMDSQEGLDDIAEETGVKSRKVREVVRKTLANTPYDHLDSPEERRAIRDTIKNRINASGILENGAVDRVFFARYVLN